jgi:uncharacterized protein HemX
MRNLKVQPFVCCDPNGWMLTHAHRCLPQGEKDAAEQQHRAVAGHLQETVKSLEAKLQAQRDLTDSYVESHTREVAELRSKIELAQVGWPADWQTSCANRCVK